MYLSRLHVNMTHQAGRQWIGSLYRVHQRLWMAFPDQEQREQDPFFLGPWHEPALPDPKPVRTQAGFLFRIERDGPLRILVQSTQPPCWHYAFQNAPHLLARSAEVREFDPVPRKNERYRFRVLAHVVERHTVACEQTRTTKSGKTIAKRKRKETWVLPAPMPQLLPASPAERLRVLSGRWDSWRNWLMSMGSQHGFDVLNEGATPLLVQPVHAVVRNPKCAKSTRYNAGVFDGVLTCVDPHRLRNALISGIGPAKAFGFGLLSLAPA